MGHTPANLVVHLIFSTKQRRPSISADIREDLRAYMGCIVREMNGSALAINGTADHVHLLVRIPPVCSVADLVRVVKTNSSRCVHQKWRQHRLFGWQTGYGVFSVSESSVTAVEKYIAEQEEHHKRRSFQEEFVEFLKENKIVYDERYIWD